MDTCRNKLTVEPFISHATWMRQVFACVCVRLQKLKAAVLPLLRRMHEFKRIAVVFNSMHSTRTKFSLEKASIQLTTNQPTFCTKQQQFQCLRNGQCTYLDCNFFFVSIRFKSIESASDLILLVKVQ